MPRGSALLGARSSLGASQSPRGRRAISRFPCRGRGGSDGRLGPWRLRRALHLYSSRWAGSIGPSGATVLLGHLGSAAWRLFPLSRTWGDRAPLRGSVLLIVNNNKGGNSRAPWCLRPLRGLRPPLSPRPLWNLDSPANGGDPFILVLLVGKLVQPVWLLPAFYLQDRSLGRLRHGKPRLLGHTAVLLRGLTTLSLPHALRFLLLLGPFSLLVPGPVFGPELLILRDRGAESP